QGARARQLRYGVDPEDDGADDRREVHALWPEDAPIRRHDHRPERLHAAVDRQAAAQLRPRVHALRVRVSRREHALHARLAAQGPAARRRGGRRESPEGRRVCRRHEEGAGFEVMRSAMIALLFTPAVAWSGAAGQAPAVAATKTTEIPGVVRAGVDVQVVHTW